MTSTKTYIVETTVSRDHHKKVSLRQEGKTPLALLLPRFALVGPNDVLVVAPGQPPRISIVSSEEPEDQIPVLPVYEHRGVVNLGNVQAQYVVTEPHRPDDFTALAYLEQFHYKTFAAKDATDLEKGRRAPESTGGRKAVLLCYLKFQNISAAVGYLELQMPLLMVKPRHELFANPFRHPTRPIEWAQWDTEAMRKHVNTIARVARVVVAPDFRGLGLAKALVESAKEFARTRWHIGGRRPLFLEISAEMLNYIDFVSSSGFVYIGRTEGNLERIVSDLLHMRKGYSISSGIMSLQQKYLRALERYCDESSKHFDDVLRRLAEILQSDDPQTSLSPSEWLAFRNVIRFPLPYYLCPLDEAAAAYLAAHASQGDVKGRPKTRFRLRVAGLRLRDLKVEVRYEVPHTKHTRLIMDAFGLKGDLLQQTVVGPIDVEASPGNIVFIAGASGSGKSVLLRALDPEGIPDNESLIRTYRGRQNYSVAWLRPILSDKPIFDYFADRYSTEATFTALSNVGLAEAFVFLKPFQLLSRGQRYRAMLADLLLRDDHVWIIDEFCSDLDPLTAKIVSHNLRRHVIRTGRICFIAAANHLHFVDALKPTAVIVLSVGSSPRVVSMREYKNELLYKVG